MDKNAKIGSVSENSVRYLSLLVKEVVGFVGEIIFDSSKLDRTPRMFSDVSRLHGMGWRHKIKLKEGVTDVYTWYRSQSSPEEVVFS